MFFPKYSITSTMQGQLKRIEELKRSIDALPLTPRLLRRLKETARAESAHYSTKIEGNRLTLAQVEKLAQHPQEATTRDQKEVMGYLDALDFVHQQAKKELITEATVQKIHGIVMGGGKKKIQPTPYRDGQNVIRDGSSRAIVYLPPEAHDVPPLMKDLVDWLSATRYVLACPLRAGIAHYQFVIIHPYFDGNGRTARLLATLILYQEQYGLRGIVEMDAFYDDNLMDYYRSLALGPSHNYYEGHETTDITPWLEFFCTAMVNSFEAIYQQAVAAAHEAGIDQAVAIQELDNRQRTLLPFLEKRKTITSQDVATILALTSRTARALCLQWAQEGFLVVAEKSKKKRLYTLAPRWAKNS